MITQDDKGVFPPIHPHEWRGIAVLLALVGFALACWVCN